uniref:Uncharacterized protein n=1 Tax=Candidozyma auris TaxID=498019 RepID=A0A0L0NSR5_CANAR
MNLRCLAKQEMARIHCPFIDLGARSDQARWGKRELGCAGANAEIGKWLASHT